jgi:Zinc finger, C2H2 type
MPDYICSRCQKVFFQKCDYQRHVSRKFPCKIVGEKIQYKCEFCSKSFTRKYNLNRHLDICSDKRTKEIVRKEMDERLKEEMEKLRAENRQLQIIQNNSNNNNITQNINIVAYGKEDTEKLLTNNDFRSIMRRGMMSIPELVRRIHFDEKTPENHNVYISNLRGKYVLMHDEKKWRLVDLKEALQQIYGDHYDILMTKFEELVGIDFLDETTVDKFRIFLNYVNSSYDENDEPLPNKYVEMVKEFLKKALYENRDIVKNS